MCSYCYLLQLSMKFETSYQKLLPDGKASLNRKEEHEEKEPREREVGQGGMCELARHHFYGCSIGMLVNGHISFLAGMQECSCASVKLH